MAGIILLGTASNAGKSAMVAALLRIYKRRGFKVCPFKAQNMALNSGVTKSGEEIGRAQLMQAEAAGIEADHRMNPILLKPTGKGVSQVIVNGRVLKNMSTKEYYASKPELFKEAIVAYRSLEKEYDIIIAEGAGSASEINLKSVDMVNMGFAKSVNIPALLVADIDRGGMFGAVVGTHVLFDDEERNLFKGTIVNKFRGDVSILEPGLEMLEEYTKRPVLGVVPYMDITLDAEDSLATPFQWKQNAPIDIAVIKFPHVSNITDVAPFALYDDVSLRYVERVEEVGDPDLLILPGTKNTMADLKWLKESGIYARVLRHAHNKKPLFAICGGFQMLGARIRDPHKIEEGGEIDGLHLIDADTEITSVKEQKRVETTITYGGDLLRYGEELKVKGYELHMGRTTLSKEEKPLTEYGGVVLDEHIFGSYLHGFFDAPDIADSAINRLRELKNLERGESVDYLNFKDMQYEKLADGVEAAIDMNILDKILGIKKERI
ncbi:cobyric acid synthase CobQ [Aedoeadaptatus nemausensis]|uniref:Cobyric acid synthase n=1 Tax=Aedoeadaptatus nemausensis TaxID=2582829 RepID=A0A6V6XZ29_9FIRM|nr:cobyric acid synthase [Peptoniphilus nemausensis]CAC9924497.1 cobyric acid synthase CobQ [Peptoniphilus nemausensis]